MNKEYFINQILSMKYGPYFKKEDIYAIENIVKDPIIDKEIRDAFCNLKFENKLKKIANKFYSLTTDKQPTVEEVLTAEFGKDWTYYGDYFSRTLRLSNQVFKGRTIAIKKNITQRSKYSKLKQWLWQNNISYIVVQEDINLKLFAYLSIFSNEYYGEKSEQFKKILKDDNIELEDIIYSNLRHEDRLINAVNLTNKWKKTIKRN